MKWFTLLLLLCLCSVVKAQEINVVTSSVVESTTTSTTGTNFVPLATNVALIVRVFNTTGATLDFQFYGKGKAIPVPTASQMVLRGIYNSNQLAVKRDDNSNTPVTVFYIIER